MTSASSSSSRISSPTALRRATIMDEREQAASEDYLTGLANRPAFLAGLDRSHRHGRNRQTHVVAALYFDLDGFKPINDTYGHAVGDEVPSDRGTPVGRQLPGPGSGCPDRR